VSVPIQAIPYLRLFKRLFLGQSSLGNVAFRQDVLFPEETATLRPAIYLPGQMEKVIDYRPTDTISITTKETEVRAATSTNVTYAPTIAYHIKNAVLFDGCIYVGRFKHPISDRSLFKGNGAREPSYIKSCGLASTYLGTKYFGHWLLDDCTKYLLAEEFGAPLSLRMPAYGHLQQYQTYFSQNWACIDRAYIDHLVVFQDFSQSSFKRKRYEILRKRLQFHFPERAPSTFVYLKRGNTGVARTIENENEIVDSLTKRGFLIADVATDGLDKLIRTLSSAKIVVSLEGSHNDHCALVCPEDSALLILQPADRFAAFQRAWSECLGMRYGFVVGDARSAGYYFSTSEILQTVDLLLARMDA